MNCIHKSRPLSLNNIARPVFVNNYYAGEPLIPVTSKELIGLDECNISTENSVRKLQSQGVTHKSVEPSRDFLRIPIVMGKNIGSVLLDKQHRGFHSKFVETSRHLLGTLNVGKSWVQVADCVDPQQVPLTGYEDFRQELQAYPVSRDPVTVQPTVPNNMNNSALLDLPNVNTNLPPPLTPQQLTQVMTDAMNVMSQPIQQQTEAPIATNIVNNSDILESIQKYH